MGNNKQKTYSCKIFTVWEEDVELASGKKTRQSWIDHKPTIAVVAVNAKNEILLIRQFRVPTGQTFWKFQPAHSMMTVNHRWTVHKGSLPKKPGIGPES